MASATASAAFAQRPAKQLKVAKRHGARSGNVLMQWSAKPTREAADNEL